MRTQIYRVNLTQDQRGHLLDLARRGKSSARKVKRSLILCKADEGLTDQQVSEALLVGPGTAHRVRRRFAQEGMESALNERPRPGQPRKRILSARETDPEGEAGRRFEEVFAIPQQAVLLSRAKDSKIAYEFLSFMKGALAKKIMEENYGYYVETGDKSTDLDKNAS